MAASDDLPRRIQLLPGHLARMLSNVEPSEFDMGLTLYPCEVETTDGAVHPRVYLAEARRYVRIWGVWPWDDSGKTWIPVESILSLRSSPLRLPARFANQLHKAGESGMGYCAFSMQLRNGELLYWVTGNAVDFLQWPEGVGPDDVLEVHPHVRHSHRYWPYERGAGYSWAPFRTQ